MHKYCIVSVTDYFKNNMKKKNFFHIINKKDLNLKKINTINPRIIFFPHWNWKISEEIYWVGFVAVLERPIRANDRAIRPQVAVAGRYHAPVDDFVFVEAHEPAG